MTELLTVGEVAAKLHVSPKTVRRQKSKIGFVRVGGSVRFREEDVVTFVRRNLIYQDLALMPRILRKKPKHLKVTP